MEGILHLSILGVGFAKSHDTFVVQTASNYGDTGWLKLQDRKTSKSG